MDAVVSPVWFYLLLAVGGIGVALALPRPRVSPQLLGGLIAAIGFGGIFLALGLHAAKQSQSPGLFFYLFAFIALGSALRVISHQRPVYAALYFILTILSSSGLYLLASAEFMAFALIIIYAGAILITYLFVIMLATQAPTEDQVEALSEYDAVSREPLVAVGLGFALIAVLSGMLARGLNEAQPMNAGRNPNALLVELPRKVIRGLDQEGVFAAGLGRPSYAEVRERFDPQTRTIGLNVVDAEAFKKAIDKPEFIKLIASTEGMSTDEQSRLVSEIKANVTNEYRVSLALPESVQTTNIDEIGWALIAEHPMALELAGVILLMAMLGAVVLARKQIELGEAEKEQAARQMAAPGTSGPVGGVM